MQTHFKIQYKTTVNAPIEKVWDALTNPEVVKKYFFETQLVTSWEVGSDIVFQGEWNGHAYKDSGKVLEYSPNKKLVYTSLSSWRGKEDIPDNYLWVCYEVMPAENATELTISQTNYDEGSAKHSEVNWASIIDGMKKIIEH